MRSIALIRCGAVVLGTLVPASWSAAQTSSPAPAAKTAEPAATATKRGFLWEARKGDARVYLYGTIHFGKPEFWPPAPEQAARFAEVEVVALESDPTNAQRNAAALQKYAILAPGAPAMDSAMSADARSRYAATLTEMGLDGQRLARMKPWMVALTLSVVEAQRIGLSAAYSSEGFLLTLAKDKGKRVDEIEGMEKQLSLFDTIAPAQQLTYLVETVEAIDSGEAKSELNAVVDAWARADGAALESRLAKLRASKRTSEQIAVQRLLDDRNPGMADYVERAAASGKLHLVAVGALHYFGPKGLVALLQQRGFTVKAL